jgi:hypothetical protein
VNLQEAILTDAILPEDTAAYRLRRAQLTMPPTTANPESIEEIFGIHP